MSNNTVVYKYKKYSLYIYDESHYYLHNLSGFIGEDNKNIISLNKKEFKNIVGAVFDKKFKKLFEVSRPFSLRVYPNNNVKYHLHILFEGSFDFKSEERLIKYISIFTLKTSILRAYARYVIRNLKNIINKLFSKKLPIK